MGRAGSRHLTAADVQLGMLDQWSSEAGLKQAQSWLDMQEENQNDGAISFGYRPEYLADGGVATRDMVMAKEMYWAINSATTYWVSADMMGAVEEAIPDMPHEPLHPMDMPTPSGFALFERPIYVIDRRGNKCNVSAVMWSPTYFTIAAHRDSDATELQTCRGIKVSYFSNTYDSQDEGWRGTTVAERRESRLPAYVLLGQAMWPWKDPDGAGRDADGNDVFAVAMRVANKAMHSGVIEDFPEYPADDPDALLHYEWDTWGSSFLVALWRIATQTIVQVGHRGYDRPTRRRIERSKHNPEWGDVRTIDLRRFVYPGQQSSGMDEEAWMRWTHRWRVKGHWRRQWFPSEQRHKWVYIASYIKGPEEMPLIEKDDVHRVVR